MHRGQGNAVDTVAAVDAVAAVIIVVVGGGVDGGGVGVVGIIV